MTTWKAGMLVTAARLNDDTPLTTNSGVVIASGFSLVDFTGYRVGNVIELRAYVQRTGSAITPTSGNIADTTICTFPAGWRPTAGTTQFYWGSGIEGGDYVIGTDGVATLRTATDAIDTGANIRLHAVFVVDS